MVVNAGPQPSSTSWVAWEFTYEGTVAFPDCVPGGTTIEAWESTTWVDSSSKLKGGEHSSLQQELAGDLYAYCWIHGRYHGLHLSTCTNEPFGEDLCARFKAVINREPDVCTF